MLSTFYHFTLNIHLKFVYIIWAPSSEFVSSSIPSWQILTAHTQPFRGARDLAFCLNVPLDSMLVWASSEGSGETARMRRLTWTFAARIGYKYQIRLKQSVWFGEWLNSGYMSFYNQSLFLMNNISLTFFPHISVHLKLNWTFSRYFILIWLVLYTINSL